MHWMWKVLSLLTLGGASACAPDQPVPLSVTKPMGAGLASSASLASAWEQADALQSWVWVD